MTMQERQDMFAKEYLSIDDIQKLYDISYPMASKMILDIKKKLTIGKCQELRLTVQGKIHIQDYLDYLGIQSDRYGIYKGEQLNAETSSYREYLQRFGIRRNAKR